MVKKPRQVQSMMTRARQFANVNIPLGKRNKWAGEKVLSRREKRKKNVSTSKSIFCLSVLFYLWVANVGSFFPFLFRYHNGGEVGLDRWQALRPLLRRRCLSKRCTLLKFVLWPLSFSPSPSSCLPQSSAHVIKENLQLLPKLLRSK